MEKEIVDYTLVPLGLLMMLLYHLWLLYRVMKHPNTTVVGVNAMNRRFWLHAMMEAHDPSKNGVLSLQTLRNNIMASTLLASTTIMLSSVIAVLMTSRNDTQYVHFLVYGDTSKLGISIKFFSILVCFLVAFLFNVQSIRYYSHASILINVLLKKMSSHQHFMTEYVVKSVNKGSYFWSLGLRALYFSFPLFFWIFGPIPMFVCCFVQVSMSYFLDMTAEFGWAVGISDSYDDNNIHFADDLAEQNQV